VSGDSTIPTPATPDVCTFAVLIEGAELPGEFHVLSLCVSREINRIPTATLHVEDGEAAKATFKASNTAQFVPGKQIEIQLGYRSKNETVFKGIILKQSLKLRKNRALLVVECRDKAVKMTGGLKSRYFIDRKDSEIMEEIIGSYDLEKDVQATKPELKAVVQYDATDWDFLLCRAEANGLLVMLEDGKVRVSPPLTTGKPALDIVFGATLLELDVEMDARRQSPGVTASSWNPSDQEVISADAKEPETTNNGNLNPKDLSDVLGGTPHQIKHGGKLSAPELQAWADGRLLKERLAKVQGRAKFQGFASLLPGNIVSIGGIGERFEGKLYASGVRHTVANGNWETDVQFGLNTEPFSEASGLRPLSAGGLLPAVAGLQLGVVTALENDPDGEDRIKVRLPLISTAEEGIWARVATLDAGKQRGTFFRPEIGDEVVVGFLGDDPRHPLILGACHSSAKPAPEAAKDTNHRKGYVSREKMRLVFDDEGKVILLDTPAGNKLTLSEEDKNIIIDDQNKNRITLDDSGIKIESSKDLTLKAAKDVKIEGMNLTLKAQSAFKATGTASAEISATSMSVKGSANTVIQGGMVQIN